MNVIDIMTTKVISISPDASIHDAGRMMLDNAIGGLLVLNESKKLQGIITESDLLHRSEIGTECRSGGFAAAQLGPEACARAYIRSYGQTVAYVMTPHPVSVGESTPLASAVDLLERHRFRRLPVVRDDSVVGVVSRSDFIRALLKAPRNLSDDAASDNAIRVNLLKIYSSESWAPLSLIDVGVKNGIVELRGSIDSESKHRALLVAARNVPGVKGVRDCLATVRPSLGPTRLTKGN